MIENETSRRSLRLALVFGPLLVLGLAIFGLGAHGSSDPVGTPATFEPTERFRTLEERWKDVEQLLSEQKFQAALEEVDGIEVEARTTGNAEEITRALIRKTQLRTALHGYETAVRELREAEWPDDSEHRAILDLFYAQSLVHYLQVYGWEIGQRELVVSTEEIDLAAWTRKQIVAEANRAFRRVWDDREEWKTRPVGPLGEYLQENTYPPRIRGTLRDTVTYLWAELLGNTGFWEPADSQDVFTLDLARLLAGGADGVSDVDPADSVVHPLVRVVAVLGDLEDWHRTGERPAAAFEARLERLRRLWTSFDGESDREEILRDMESRLDRLGRHDPWWSTGMAQRAEFVRQGDDPDALVSAREIAREGHRAHPGSLGGERCLHIAETIEAPAYRVEAMTVDGPGRRSIRVEHRNFDRLFFRAYRVDLLDVVEEARDYNLLPSSREVEEVMKGRSDAAWAVDLPPTPDYRSHATDVVPPLSRPGLFVVVASAREDFDPSGNRIGAVNVLITDLVLVSRRVDGLREVTVRSGATGKRVTGAEVFLYRFDWQNGHHREAVRRTGADGRVRFGDVVRETHFVVARRGDDVSLDPMYYSVAPDLPPGPTTSSLVYTDRSVYRPGQEIAWKVVAYRGTVAEGRYEVLPDQPVTVSLQDANGEVAASAEATTNDHGSASGTLVIPPGRLLGRWSLQSSLGGASSLLVEEYERPSFEVTVAEPEEALRLNRPARLNGEARYYFGLPVAAGTVTWRVTREPVYPRWWWWSPPPSAQPRIVAGGKSPLDEDGAFAVEFLPAAPEPETAADRAVSYRYRLSVDVTDEGGETRSATRVFRLGHVSVEATLTPARGFLRPGEAIEVEVARTDLDGTPRPGEGSWELVELAEPAEALLPVDQPLPRAAGEEDGYRTAGDRRRPRWSPETDPRAILRSWEDGEVVARGTMVAGEEVIIGPPVSPGAYRLRYRTEDPFGAVFETAVELVSAIEGGRPLEVPAILRAERSSVAVGETARLLVATGLEDQPVAVELYRDGRYQEGWYYPASTRTEVIEIPVTEELRGGFGVTLTLVRDHQLVHLSEHVFVPWDDRELTVTFSTFRDRLRPGSKETWTIDVAGPDGEALAEGAAEVLASMYDRSLDLFAPHRPPDPLGLYPNRSGVGGIRTNLGHGSEVWTRGSGFARVTPPPVLREDRLAFLSGYGIGGLGRGGRAMRSAPEIRSMAAIGEPAPDEYAAFEAREELELEDVDRDDVVRVTSESPRLDEEAAPGVELRTDFAETAFWEPHLVVDEEGTVAFEVEVPDSVTEWNVWVRAVTRDLRAGSAHRTTRTVKELMVRPSLPRFLREGDRAELEVVVNNAGEETMTGDLRLRIVDPETGESLARSFGLPGDEAVRTFAVEPGKGTTVTIPVQAPYEPRSVAFEVVAEAGGWSDGERRPLPVLPGRIHLSQSRFAALRDADRRVLEFADMRADDPTLHHDRLVVTLDAQLFFGVLDALPYLVDYPYECTEQTLNRFLSTGILASVFHRYPEVAAMAEELAARETRLEAWDEPDPNRAMLLEETPWLLEARGGGDSDDTDLLKVLDPRVAEAQRREALSKLEEAQTSLGAFPWWPGGPPSPYMTLYALQGFSRALEHGIEVPRPMVERAWASMHRHYVDEMVEKMMGHDCCWEMVTFLNYVLSSYPDESWTGGVFTADDRRRMLEFSFRHWREHSPRTKAYLALTLHRSGREGDATLVFDSIMDSARTDPDLGTYWAPEDRAWLWYNDTVESHSFVLRAMSELDPDDPRRQGLVQWLFLNKKLSHWKSTRATAEAIYALVHSLERDGALGITEAATVRVGPRVRTFEWDPGEYTGKSDRVVVLGAEVDPDTMSTIEVAKETPGLMFASATWHFSTEELPEEARGDLFSVTRRFFRRAHDGSEWRLEPLEEGAELAPGDQVEVQLAIRAKHAAEYVHLRVPRGAGFEPETLTSGIRWDLGLAYYEEVRDSGTNFFFEWLPAGEYTLRTRLRAATSGEFRVAPATLQSMYAPEFAAYSSGKRVEIHGD